MSKKSPLGTKSTPPLLRLTTPVKGRFLALHEHDFKRIFIDEACSIKQAMRIYGISNHIGNTSRHIYSKKYGGPLSAIRSRRIAVALVGNQHGKKEHPKIVIPKEALFKAVSYGKTTASLCRLFKVSERIIKSNLKFYGASLEGELPAKFQSLDPALLDEMDRFAPGLLKAAKTYYEDPGPTFELLYRAFLKIQELSWFVKSHGKMSTHYRQKNRLPANHICFSTNRFENRLAIALLDLNIPHIRQMPVGPIKSGCFVADFYFPQIKTAVELDGGFHLLATQQGRDIKKEKLLSEVGIKVVRFSSRMAWEHPEKIIKALNL
jgi:very-short-patch-repair endonuclease